jgi:hypothetical protein
MCGRWSLSASAHCCAKMWRCRSQRYERRGDCSRVECGSHRIVNARFTFPLKLSRCIDQCRSKTGIRQSGIDAAFVPHPLYRGPAPGDPITSTTIISATRSPQRRSSQRRSSQRPIVSTPDLYVDNLNDPSSNTHWIVGALDWDSRSADSVADSGGSFGRSCRDLPYRTYTASSAAATTMASRADRRLRFLLDVIFVFIFHSRARAACVTVPWAVA